MALYIYPVFLPVPFYPLYILLDPEPIKPINKGFFFDFRTFFEQLGSKIQNWH